MIPLTVFQKCVVAERLDRCDGRGRLLAFYRGEPWAVSEMADMAMVEFFWSVFNVPGGGEM